MFRSDAELELGGGGGEATQFGLLRSLELDLACIARQKALKFMVFWAKKMFIFWERRKKVFDFNHQLIVAGACVECVCLF